MPLESVKMKNSKIGLRHDRTGPKWHIEPTFQDAWTSGGFGKQTHKQTNKQTNKIHVQVFKYRYRDFWF